MIIKTKKRVAKSYKILSLKQIISEYHKDRIGKLVQLSSSFKLLSEKESPIAQMAKHWDEYNYAMMQIQSAMYA